MIDWITAFIPYPHTSTISDGSVINVDEDGLMRYSIATRKVIEGSYSDTITIKSVTKVQPNDTIELSGNPVKFLQGHNVYGSDNIQNLLFETLKPILEKVLPIEELNLFSLKKSISAARITRIDITHSYDLGSSNSAQTFIRAMEQSAHLRNKGRGQFSGDTLYWGKTSTRWSLKLYNKGQEIEVRDKKLGKSFDSISLDSLKDYANKLVRIELTLRGQELDDLQLAKAESLTPEVLDTLFKKYISRLEISDNIMSKQLDIMAVAEKLPTKLKGVYSNWATGLDIKSLYSRPTLYRHRSEIKKLINVDIFTPAPDKQEQVKAVPCLIEVLTARPAVVPPELLNNPKLTYQFKYAA